MDHPNSKKDRLRNDGVLHPHPKKFHTELLSQSDFFDANDLVQMKYEMLRSASLDDRSVTEAAQSFGLSRVAFYRAQQQYNDQGLMGLLPQKRGPKKPHKLTDAILDFVREQLADEGESLNWEEVSRQIQKHFGTDIHPRSIERAVKKPKKKGDQ